MKTGFKLLILYLMIAPLFGDSGTVGRVEYGTYVNHRYQCELKYPKDLLFPGHQPDNNDGRGFVSKDQRVQIGVQGKHLVVNNWAEEYEEVLNDHNNAKATKKTFNKKVFVVTGIEDGNIFYEKGLYLGPDDNPVILRFDATYPENEKEFWKPIVDFCTKSFKPLKVIDQNLYGLAGLGPNKDEFK